jgi:hypothetical protein
MRKGLLFVAFAFLVAGDAFAQDTGFPPHGSFHEGRFDVINRKNLNVQLAIPVVSSPGRGTGFSFAISYNSLIWKVENDVWVPVTDEGGTPTWGWNRDRVAGSVYYDVQVQECEVAEWIPDYGWSYSYEYANFYQNYRYVDASGTVYTFPLSFYDTATQCGYATGPRTGYGSAGFYIDATSETNPIVLAPDGTKIQNGLTPLTDTNGNYLSLVVVSSTETHWKDSVGRVALKIKKFTDRIEYVYFDAGGVERTIKMYVAPVQVGTNFQCPGWTEYTGTVDLPVRVDLPNNQSYFFTYEETTGRANHFTGRLKRVTLPTGGYLEYQYLGTPNNGIFCSDKSLRKVTRMSYDGVSSTSWDFTREPTSFDGSGNPVPPWKTIETPPVLPYESQANQTLYIFSDTAETGRQIYRGSIATGTLLRRVDTVRAGDGSPQTTTVILESNQQTKTETLFDQFGNPSAVREYAWGQGTPGPIVRATITSYLGGSPYVARNIRNRVSTIQV